MAIHITQPLPTIPRERAAQHDARHATRLFQVLALVALIGGFVIGRANPTGAPAIGPLALPWSATAVVLPCDTDGLTAQISTTELPSGGVPVAVALELGHVADACAQNFWRVSLLDASRGTVARADGQRLGFALARPDDNTAYISFQPPWVLADDVAYVSVTIGNSANTRSTRDGT